VCQPFPYLQTPLPRKLTFADPPKIVEMAERGGALKDLAAKQALDSELRHPDEAGKLVPDADAEAVRQAVRTPGAI
jgi:hypothetical protein